MRRLSGLPMSVHCFTQKMIIADGYPVDGLNAHEMSELQRGPLGSTVALTIAPVHSELAPETIYLERRPLPQPPLKQVEPLALSLQLCTHVQICTQPFTTLLQVGAQCHDPLP